MLSSIRAEYLRTVPNNTQPPPGYHGCYLRIDLSTGISQRVELAPSILRNYLGGSGLGTYLLLREGSATVDPLSAAASMAFVFSPLVGSPLTTSAKFAVVSKSPLTNRINDSLASSGFAIAGKQTGCDAIVLVGSAARPAVLLVDELDVRFEPAEDLWGLDCATAQQRLSRQYGSDFRYAVIGPAGERQVRYATISHDGRHAGRGGSGAVLGAKNIKAIGVRGTQRCRWSDPAALTKLAKEISSRSLGPATAKYRELGTASNLLLFNRLGALPSRNFQQGQFAGVAALDPVVLAEKGGHARSTCVACTIGCEHLYSLGASSDTEPGVRVEYENLFALGPLCGINDSEVVLQASRRCDELGVDTISAGGTISFAMECVERGLLDLPWLTFGDGAALLRAIDLIGRRDGAGDWLAEGSRRLADRLGGGSAHFAPHVKGLEMPGYEPRAMQTMALGFAVGSRGADHNRSGAYEVDFSERVNRYALTPQSVPFAIETENAATVMDSLILCKFLRRVFTDFFQSAAEMLEVTTGWNVSAEELIDTANRIVSAKKLFNIRAGWTPEEDSLPNRFLQEPQQDNAEACLSAEQLQNAVRLYNELRGWSADGWIAPGSADKLGLPSND
ncbi:MAG: aldehyde:ferredoxin oxidoreductase [Planctomycetaceae bacterium]|nr:aldehyde:ferredoxin oxidoreductase [Planctomycetaceae bacterium]